MSASGPQDNAEAYDCVAFGCTGTATRPGGLCPWHRENGRPEDIITPGATKPYLGTTARRGRAKVEPDRRRAA